VTVSVPDAGITDGAVYKPADVTVPATAAQFVAFDEVNCWVAPKMSVTDAGETAPGGKLVTRVTAAEDEPAALVALTVSVPDKGIADGAVYRPAEVTLPETALQLVAPAAVNCRVPFSITVTVAGEITGGTFVSSVTVAED
jgi:hypothetical protein